MGMRYFLYIFLVSFFTFQSVFAASVFVLPNQQVLQGEPVMVRIDDVASVSEISKTTFDGKSVPVFLYQNKPTVLLGIDLNKLAGEYTFVASLKNGLSITQTITVLAREKKTEPLGIPEKLGGNTLQAQIALVTSLVQENAILNSLWTGKKAFWTQVFRYPLASNTVTDAYGYTRLTGQYTIAHKGVDLRASQGTKVYAMNRGVVRLARMFRNYGKTIVVDHGLGVQTMYMHLSKIYVNVGELVLPGQLIAKSGMTGYAEQPHLHITARLGGISIDPIKFLALFGK
ncbi:MAG: hypothetical protein COX61_00575 [Candidatus Brennerbacteria bacterium CG_4_10_14_0_2_um_filter_43_14]|nr:MAG: hypothetical protein COX61_00575 [Candidatus Brennerbacteria bacterium CG_4_10_14_0_2_um_filter_43_14]